MSNHTNVESIPSTCRTVIFDPATQKLNFHSAYPVPELEIHRNDHLIRVHATALCARELAWPIEFPDAMYADNPTKTVIPGYDLSGTVVKAPPNSPFPVGSEIYTRTAATRPGNYRDFTIARTEEMALKPKNTNWIEAATVPLSVFTAWQALFEHAGINGLNDEKAKGKRLLVTAAAGGVGIWLVQLGRLAGLEVVAQIGGEESAQLATELGATETINYKKTGLRDYAIGEKQFDIIIDLVGGKTLEEEWYAVKEGGVLISIFQPPESARPAELKEKNVKNSFFIMVPKGEQLAEVTKLLEDGKCKPLVDSVWEFDQYEEAFKRLDGGHSKGKIVIQVSDA